jgi:hypothetical protein
MMTKKIRGIGIAPKRKRRDQGLVPEVWADGTERVVRAYRGVDRRVYVRFSPKPAIGINGREYPARGRK